DECHPVTESRQDHHVGRSHDPVVEAHLPVREPHRVAHHKKIRVFEKHAHPQVGRGKSVLEPGFLRALLRPANIFPRREDFKYASGRIREQLAAFRDERAVCRQRAVGTGLGPVTSRTGSAAGGTAPAHSNPLRRARVKSATDVESVTTSVSISRSSSATVTVRTSAMPSALLADPKALISAKKSRKC